MPKAACHILDKAPRDQRGVFIGVMVKIGWNGYTHFNQFYPGMIRGDRYVRFTAYE
jgi:hypothetical protein